MLVCWLGNEQRLSQLLSGFILATLVTLLIAGILPAVGGYAHHGIGEADYGYLKGSLPGVSYLDQFHAVRLGTLRRLGVEPAEGLTQFPSFHTVLALVSAWAIWHLRWIGPVNAAYSGVVILTTLPVGGHHLMDLLGAAVVVAASLLIAGWVEKPAQTAAAVVPADDTAFVWMPASIAR